MSKPFVMAAMSGGVDSSVSAHLLQQQGFPLAGMFMKNWEEDDDNEHCTAAQDANDARAVCQLLGIPFHGRNFAAEYWDEVFEAFLAEHRAGRTPNPDILCNREIKFKTFLAHARDLGADEIATGHYCRRGRDVDGRYTLERGVDNNKDQSYFLYTLGQQQLAATRFPVGELEKPRVREIAQTVGIPVAAKKDSTGICFIGERRHAEFLSQYLRNKPGVIRDIEHDREVGEHDGLHFFTIGQRQGLGIGGTPGGSGEPWFVVGKDFERDELLVVQGDHPALYAPALAFEQASFVAGEAPSSRFAATAKTRYRQPDQQCQVELSADGDTGTVRFDQAQRAITPGQSIVFYRDNVCLGGAVIDRAVA